MMDPLALDPYEQQLLSVFDSYDHDNLGSLDRDGLTQLCHTLQLEEQASELIRCLLKDPKHSRATFTEFKDALLALLGNMQQNNKTTTATMKSDDFVVSPVTMKNNQQNNKSEANGSPEREVSPKYVYGSKKYGRRSRPRSDEITVNAINEQNDPNYINKNSSTNGGSTAVQRSNSQSEVSNSKKRKTNYKLKRCTSLPGGGGGHKVIPSSPFDNNVGNCNNFITSLTSETTDVWTEEMLREAWRKLGVGEDGYLNQTELVLVCDAIGLHKLAEGVIRQLSNNLTMDFDHRISFQELLEALQQDETWSEVLEGDPVSVNSGNSVDTMTLSSLNSEIFPDSRTFQYVTLGPDGNGIITAETLVEMWEAVGITSPKELIHELGFNCREISVVDLAVVLEKEIKGMADSTRMDVQNPHMVLLQANLTLYQSEIRCLKSFLEQMHAEREKLKCDVGDANNRANLLAQEVDDNHVRMERNTQNQVKLLEQRHSEILKQLSEQYAGDKEQLNVFSQQLEAKICSLELEAGKLKNDLLVAQNYSNSVEKENHNLSGRINELQQIKDALSDQISALEGEKQKYVEMEQEQIEPLLSKLATLQMENAQLRDRNDEMVAEIESLHKQASTMRTKVLNTPTYNTLDQSMEENICCEGVGLGAKRRSDYSPTKDDVLFGIADSSPRLGKVRKFHNKEALDNHLVDAVGFSSSESGFEAEVDCLDSSLSTSAANDEEVNRLQAKIAFLEQILAQHSIPVPSEGVQPVTDELDYLKNRVHSLERVWHDLSEISSMIDKNRLSSEDIKGELRRVLLLQNADYCDGAGKLDKIEAGVGTEPFEELLKNYEEKNLKLKTKCEELENCVELLRNEYEKCEDYWQSKLDEERQIFEAEQVQSSEKLTDLINKMAEYEEQFASQDMVDNRLPTIEETYNLEKQFTDLEQEFEDYKAQSENEIFKRDEEISILKQKLTEVALDGGKDVATQSDDTDNDSSRIHTKMNGLSLCMVETTNLFSADAMPPSPWTVPTEAEKPPLPPRQPQREFVNPAFAWNKEQASTSSASSTTSGLEKNSSTPCRPKRTRKHDRNNFLYKKNEAKDNNGSNNNVNNSNNNKKAGDGAFRVNQEQMVMMPVSTVQGLNGRLHHLEQRCRQLQMMLKQQHYYTEQSLQQCRQHHRGEKTELQCILRSHQERLDQQVRICNEQLERLARSDMLVKELYVENSYLIAKVQRLEQQCHILAQCNSNSSSV